ncbi:ATP-binding protein [Priestia megaterium]|uniref:ATP-binding protein n=1 Tax=Priestia megaterium TaxID=1404 RepID=UPI003D2BAA81
MQKISLPIDPVRIANQIIQTQKEIDNTIEVEDAVVKMFSCEKCSRELITGISYKLNINENWENNFYKLCTECIDEGELSTVGSQILHRRSESIMNEYWTIENSLVDAGIKNFSVINKETKIARDCAEEYLKNMLNHSNNQNLLLFGGHGTGKSHLATAIARNARGKHLSVGFANLNNLLGKFYMSYNNTLGRSEKQILEDIRNFDLFILDDIYGHCHKRSFFQSKLEEIISVRQSKPTVYTTCESEDKFEQLIGKRICSRIKTNTRFIYTGSLDYRERLIINKSNNP